MPDYQGRTELSKAGLTDGNVPLRILNIRHSDEGQYCCFVQDDTFYEETVLKLRVAEPRSLSNLEVLPLLLIIPLGASLVAL
ncbi:myelin-oligodendrocyte glycoprotein-like [Emys orbicularis]|uniref:myelin-oligodendrocyte glycoprotein-like n=1 Tax=Emys orbicularis TaxID=82168 RepID=UPI0031FD358F